MFTCVFVNNGVLRKNEFQQVQQNMRDKLGLRLVAVDASGRFLSRLAGVVDPEQKRKIIGGEFINVFDDEARRIFESERPAIAQATPPGCCLARCSATSRPV